MMQSLLLLNLLDQQVIIILARLTRHLNNERIAIILAVQLIIRIMVIRVILLLINLNLVFTHLHSTNMIILCILPIIAVLAAHLRVNIYTPHINHLSHILRYTARTLTLLPHSSSTNLPLFNSTLVGYTHRPLHLLCRTLCPHSSHTPPLHHHLLDINNHSTHNHSSRSCNSLIIIMGYVFVCSCFAQ